MKLLADEMNSPCRFLVLAALGLTNLFHSSAGPFVPISICMVQGDSEASPYEGIFATVQGVVYGDLDTTSREGFFIQEENCDANPSTADGIFIYTGERSELVSSGDRVMVSGWVNEYYGMTEISAQPQDIIVIAQGQTLPVAQELNPPFDTTVAEEYFETMEGMHVSLVEGIAVGPTDAYDRNWLVRADLGIQRVFWDDPQGTGEIICADDGGLFEISPELKVGDRVQNLAGALDYRFDQYCLEPLAAPEVILQAYEPVRETSKGLEDLSLFTVATFNLGNLFDTVDDPATDDSVLSQTAYQRKLDKLALVIHDELAEPALIALQEAENSTVLSDLLAQQEIVNEFGIVLVEGPDQRGLDLALLYRTGMVQVESYQVRQGCTRLVDGLGPDGNLDVNHPQNNIACDSDGDGNLDGNRLFSRPPLVVRMNLCLMDCAQQVVPMMVIVNHWKSKSEDTKTFQYTLPRRQEQAEFTAMMAEQVRSANPGVPQLVMGDLNDTPGSAPLVELTEQGLRDLVTAVPRCKQYSYNYQGISQVIDHVLVGLSPSLVPLAVDILHFNADFPYSDSYQADTPRRSSDHDAVLVQFGIFNQYIYLPLITHP